ncbi:MAG: tRNA pseudouridine(55) synthase TruB [Acetatifactor sp.]|nr:tRNA pseudouridine(55) synthase TruB [Acetatifactor sp.]
MLNGVIVIHKEAGFTSHDVVAKMRGICGQKKIGHTGTLDPQATGVLPVCLGSATKLCDMLTDKDKEYVAELLLGVETDTQDTTGKVLRQCDVTADEEQVEAAIRSFLGSYMQVPPMYSALKVNGKKLYELARAGKEVEREARKVTIYELEILDIQLPVVRFRVACSKGTYIRTLCADIGEKLGCGGTMKSLMRTRVGDYSIENAVTLQTLEKLRDEKRINEVLKPADSAFLYAPMLHMKEEFTKVVDNGNSFFPNQTAENQVHPAGDWVRVYRADDSFVGIYAYDNTRTWYKPVKMFLS